jgi:hypothetical protein
MGSSYKYIEYAGNNNREKEILAKPAAPSYAIIHKHRLHRGFTGQC